MNHLLDENPIASIAFVLAALIGGVVVIIQPETLTFSDYLKDMGAFGAGAGILGVARSLAGKGGKE